MYRITHKTKPGQIILDDIDKLIAYLKTQTDKDNLIIVKE